MQYKYAIILEAKIGCNAHSLGNHNYRWSQITDQMKIKFFFQIYKLLQHSLASEAVAGLVDLLEFDDKRLAVNVANVSSFIVLLMIMNYNFCTFKSHHNSYQLSTCME